MRVLALETSSIAQPTQAVLVGTETHRGTYHPLMEKHS